MNETPASILREALLHIQHEFGLSITGVQVNWIDTSTIQGTERRLDLVEIDAIVRT